jgi:hypothetical protein
MLPTKTKIELALLAVLVFLLSYGGGKPLRGADEEINFGYYENMSMIAFQYAFGEWRAESDPVKKGYYLRKASFMIFSYWVHTRKGKMVRSSRLEKFVSNIYKEELSGLEPNVFRDPMNWPKGKRPLGSVVRFRTFSEEEYRLWSVEFYEFISG